MPPVEETHSDLSSPSEDAVRRLLSASQQEDLPATEGRLDFELPSLQS